VMIDHLGREVGATALLFCCKYFRENGR